MSERSAIKGKVIRILSPYSLIVSIGSKDGVTIGMKLIVYEEGQDITGLDGKSLGKIEFVKATLQIAHVQTNFSVAENTATHEEPTISDDIATSLTIKEPLPVSQRQVEPLAPLNRTISKGDLVRTV